MTAAALYDVSLGAPTIRSVAWWALLGPEVELQTDVASFARWLREPPMYGERFASLSAA